MDIPEGGTGGAVDEEAVKRVANAAPHRAEPAVFGDASSGTEARGTRGSKGAKAARVAPVAVGLDPEHERADLVVSSQRPAEQKAVGAEAAGRATGDAVGPIAGAEAVTGVNAEIDAGPIDDRGRGQAALWQA